MANFNILDRTKNPFRCRKVTLILSYLFAYSVIPLDAFIIEDGKDDATQNRTSTANKVCDTQGCIQIANIYLKNMDQSINPCENFYQFACGNFVKNAVIPKGSTIRTVFEIIEEIIRGKIRSILEGIIDDSQPRAFKLMQDYYKVCLDIDQIDRNSEDDLRGIFKSLNGWPVLEGNSWNEDTFDWKNTTYSLGKMGYSMDSIINLYIEPDRNDSNRNIIYLNQAALYNDQEVISNGLNDPIVKAYFKYMVDFAVLLGADPEQANKDLTESLNFEIELSKICLTNAEMSDPATLFTKMKIQDLQSTYGGLPWVEYLNGIVQPGRLLTETDDVMVGSKKFFENIGSLLKNTSKRTLANYLMWTVAIYSASQMSKRVDDLSREYDLLSMGTASRKERWEICAKRVTQDMDLALGSLYVRKYFDEKSKNEISSILTNIRSSYKNIIEQLDWMIDATKKSALEKLSAMSTFLGYPSELLDDKKIDDYYKNVTIDPKSFLKSRIELDKLYYTIALSKLQKPVNKSDWILHGAAATVNAYYNPPENSIEFPAGILQEHFFSADRPKYLNYGAIGSVIGHEMTHGFDDQGSHYDKVGNFFNWWDNKTKESFNIKAQGIVEQYNKYQIKEINMNVSGQLTKSENIADNGGYKEAYLAYVELEKGNDPEPKLPGLPYSPRQLFWISAANIWCTKALPETIKHNILTNPHSPGEFRVNGPVSNRPQFSVDYNCPVGSPMNPAIKYGVW